MRQPVINVNIIAVWVILARAECVNCIQLVRIHFPLTADPAAADKEFVLFKHACGLNVPGSKVTHHIQTLHFFFSNYLCGGEK